MALLLEYERSTLKKRKATIQKELDDLREQAFDSREHLKAKQGGLDEQGLRDYYLDPINQIVHICLSIPRYQGDPQKLTTDIGLNASDLRLIIEKLERLGVIEQHNGKIRTVIKNIHLPKSSPSYKPWRNQLKLLCMERLYRRPQKQDYSFSVTFSATDKVREKIRADFLELLKHTEELVGHSKQEHAYQMSFDLFSWTEI